MDIILVYDIDTSDGTKRLNNIRKICKNFGKHIQNSVFEFELNLDEYQNLKNQLLKVVSKNDSLIFYSIKKRLYKFGDKNEYTSFDDILIF